MALVKKKSFIYYSRTRYFPDQKYKLHTSFKKWNESLVTMNKAWAADKTKLFLKLQSEYSMKRIELCSPAFMPPRGSHYLNSFK